MKREEIETKYKWDISSLFKDQQAFDEQLKDAKGLLKTLEGMKGHIADSKQTFVTFMETLETMSRYSDNLYSFASMTCDVEPNNEQGQANKAAALTFIQSSSITLSFIDLELIHHKEIIETYLEDEDLKDFRYPMDEVFRTIPHRLDEAGEELMAKVAEIAMTPSQTYASMRLEFPPVMVNGKEEFLNGATYTDFLLNPDVEVRKDAFQKFYQEYKRYENAFANLLSGHAKGQVLNASVHHFPSALEASLFADDVDKLLFDKILMMSNVTYRPILHDFFAFRKQKLQLEEQHTYDILLPLVDETNISYTPEECFDILHKALAPLGEEYLSLLDKARAENWIDFMPHEGKRTGAYSGGSYDSKPFVLMNFTGTYDSLSTMAHELGHSMHSYYSRKHNRALLGDYRIFVAEVASTVNEILLNRYLLKTSDDKEYKAYILANLLEQLVGTMYRQTMYAQFEVYLHECLEKGEPVSSSTLTSYFYELSKDYFGESTIVDDLEKYKCYFVPHFYYNFYVYKYTLGMATALSFVKKIEQGDTKKYLEFLTKGGSERPLDELIHAGVDPRDDEVYDDAFHFFEDSLNELKKLMA